MFRGVEILIYVFDIVNMDADMQRFEDVITAVEENSPSAKVFVLLHKMDLIYAEDRFRIFFEKQGAIKGRSSQ